MSSQASLAVLPKKSGWCKFACLLLSLGEGKYTKKPQEWGLHHSLVQKVR